MPISWKMFWLNSWEIGSPDSNTGALTLDGTGVDAKGFGDSGTGALTLAGTKTESLAHTGSGSCALTLAGTKTEALAHSGSGSGTITVAGTSSDALVHTGTGSGTITVAGTKTDALAHTGSGTGALTVSGSGSDGELEAGSGSGEITLDGSGVESYGTFYVDSGSGVLTLDGTAVEVFVPGVITGKSKTYRHYPPGTGDVDVSYGSLQPIFYNDSGAGVIRLGGAGVGSHSSPPRPATLAGWGREQFHVEPPPIRHHDAATVLLRLNGWLVDDLHHEGSGSGIIVVMGEGAEVFDDGFLIRRTAEDETIIAIALALA